METSAWYLALVIGTLGFILGIVFLFARRNRSQSDYIKAAAIELFSGWVLFLPYEYFEEVTVDNPLLRIVESVLTALIRVLNVFSIEGYERIIFPGHEVYTSLLSIVRVLVSISLALFACGWVISFFEGPAQYMKLLLRRKRVTYLFPQYNEKTASIARSIDTKEGRGANIIILAQKEVSDPEKAEIEAFDGIYLTLAPARVLRFLAAKAPSIEVYLFSENEQDNIALLEEAFEEKEICRCSSIRFFVELHQTPWALYDDYVARKLGKDVKNVLVNFVRSEENFIYNLLWDHSVFTAASSPKAHFLIVGMNARNLEFLKAVLHLGQMPGIDLKVTVLDEGAQLKEIQTRLPQVLFNEKYDVEGDARYEIAYLENIDLESQTMEEQISGHCGDFTYAYVNAGNDLKNISLAIRIGSLRVRSKIEEDYEIMVNLTHLSSEKWNDNRLGNMRFSGAFNEVYSRSFITMSDIETASRAIHDMRQKEKKAAKEKAGGTYEMQTWEDYCNSEYNRHSVYARTLAFRYKVRLIREKFGGDFDLTKTREWKIFEHMRWGMYTRTIGYRDPDAYSKGLFDKALVPDPSGSAEMVTDNKLMKKIRASSGVHEDLIPFEALTIEEQEKDSMTLTPEILDVLEKKNEK